MTKIDSPGILTTIYNLLSKGKSKLCSKTKNFLSKNSYLLITYCMSGHKCSQVDLYFWLVLTCFSHQPSGM